MRKCERFRRWVEADEIRRFKAFARVERDLVWLVGGKTPVS